MKRFLTVLLLCTVLVATLCDTMTVASAEQNDVELSLDVREGGENTIDVVVSLTENDGIIDLYLRVEYDKDVLELTERTYGNTLAKLLPQDNFEEGYEYPYRIIYNGSTSNINDTGRLFTLTFKVKKDVKNGNYPVKLVVRQVGYLSGDANMEPVYNEKYGEPLEVGEDPTSTTLGGVVVAEKLVAISGGSVGEIRDANTPSKPNKLMIGLIAGGSGLVIAAIVVAYLFYRKKSTTQKPDKQ